jgi:apolipoprotein N-acyltransferase
LIPPREPATSRAVIELAPSRRFYGTLVGFGLLYLASPGIVDASGSWWLAALAVATWARYASVPGRRAAWIEIATGGLAWAGICSWAAHVWWGTLLILGPGHGVYMAVQGWALRRFARRLPLAVAAPLAWLLVETVRAQLEPPFGLPWMRLGIHLHDQPWIAGSARVWGVGGLSFAMAALGGLAADATNAWIGRAGSKPVQRIPLRWPALAAGLGPLALGVVLALAIPAPETVDGPRVLLVQPAIPQERKMASRNAREDFLESVALLRRGLDEARAANEPTPDLVAWGETMLRAFVIDPELTAAMQAGAQFDPWHDPVDVERIREHAEVEKMWVDELLFGTGPFSARGVLPSGTAFLCGAEYLTPRDGRVRRENAVFLWSRPGVPREGPASKRYLVPGAETMLGLERYESVRAVILELAGYVPDLLFGADDDPVLRFTARDGRSYRIGISVCFDNAFDDAYTRPVRAGDVDFHLVASNEAWFKQSQEADQMVAFSRLMAIQTGRSVVRATNSGITCALAPDGSELGRIRGQVDGRLLDREVAGTLRVTVPVPVGGDSPLFEVPPDEREARAVPPFVRWEYAWILLWIGAPLAVLAWMFKHASPTVSAAGPAASVRLPRPSAR